MGWEYLLDPNAGGRHQNNCMQACTRDRHQTQWRLSADKFQQIRTQQAGVIASQVSHDAHQQSYRRHRLVAGCRDNRGAAAIPAKSALAPIEVRNRYRAAYPSFEAPVVSMRRKGVNDSKMPSDDAQGAEQHHDDGLGPDFRNRRNVGGDHQNEQTEWQQIVSHPIVGR